MLALLSFCVAATVSGCSRGARQPAKADTSAPMQQAVSAQDRNRALELANRVTYLSSTMTAPYSPTTPTKVLLLDYYGRELEIWSAERNASRELEKVFTRQ